MHRFIGKKKESTPAPSLSDTGKRIEERGDSLDVKINKLNVELAGYQKKLKTAKGPAAQALKKRALDMLKRKKMYEKQRDQLANQGFNIDQQAFMMESMKDTVQTVDSMKVTAKVMKKEFKKIDLDKIEDLQEDIQDLMLDNDEVQEVMGRALGFDQDVDEDELDAELAALDDLDFEDFEAESSEADYLKSSRLPSAPITDIDQGNKDAYGLPAVPIGQ